MNRILDELVLKQPPTAQPRHAQVRRQGRRLLGGRHQADRDSGAHKSSSLSTCYLGDDGILDKKLTVREELLQSTSSCGPSVRRSTRLFALDASTREYTRSTSA
jgi:hypothetical protein